jgi:diketogulonate reductase-like aldo/keto reductase
MKEQIVQDIAKKHDIEAGNVLLSYLNNRGIVGEFAAICLVSRPQTGQEFTLKALFCPCLTVLPKSVTPSRIEKNLKIVDLDKEDIEALNKFAKDSGKLKRFCNPPWGVDFKVSLNMQGLAYTTRVRIRWADPCSVRVDYSQWDEQI